MLKQKLFFQGLPAYRPFVCQPRLTYRAKLRPKTRPWWQWTKADILNVINGWSIRPMEAAIFLS